MNEKNNRRRGAVSASLPLSYVFLFISLWLVSCQEDRRVERVLDFAGDNRAELEAVLEHYKDDPEKLHAARLLIAEMEGAYYYDAPEVDSLKRMVHDIRRAETRPGEERMRLWKAFDYRTLPKVYDARTLTAEYLIGHIDGAFRAWRKWPWGKHYTAEDFYRYILPYRIGDETPDRWMETYAAYYGHLLDSLYTGTDVMAAVDTVLRCFNRQKYDYLTEFNTPHLGGLHLLENRAGGCRDFTDMAVYAFRSLGIPVAKDMFLCAPDFRHSHTWNVVMDTTGLFIPVEFMRPRDTTDIRRWTNHRNKGKVYRLYDVRQDEPDFTGNYYRADVTDEYYPANRVEVPGVQGRNGGALAVFASEGWRPVATYRMEAGKAVAENVQEGMIFQPLAVESGRLRESGWPFFVQDGQAVALKPDTARRVKVRLTRKYPLGWRMKENLDYVVDNVLEGSLTPDFRQADTLGRIAGSSVERLERYVPVRNGKAYRYVRLWPAAGSRICLSELALYADTLQQERLPYRVAGCGKPGYGMAGTSGPEHLQDHDVLSYYFSSEADVPLVVDLGHPVVLRQIVLTPHNDDNFVRRGECYELFYQDGVNGWASLGRQVAADDWLEYDRVPDHALLWLRNLTKGREEQVFRWVGGRQVFLGTMKGG